MQRRQFLKGAGGVILGLPFLESMLPVGVQAQDAAPPSFGVFIRHPHGVVHEQWWPTKIGKLSKDVMPADRACSMMVPHLSRTSFIRGLKMGWPNRNCHHNIHALQLFTGAEPSYSDRQGFALSKGESMEWTIARELQKGADPLVLLAGTRESGIINDTISFNAKGEKMIGENDPYAVYKRLFNLSAGTETRDLMRKSVNDYVREQIKAMEKNARLSRSDKERLDLHLTSIRDTEIKIAATLPTDKLEKLQGFAKDQKTLRDANANRLNEVILLQMDIIALAIASGAVRGVSYQLLAGIDDTRFTLDGARLLASHGASHHEASGNKEENLQTLRRLDRFWQEAIAYLATALSKDVINGKPLLDYGVIMATTEISEGTSHQENNIPHMLVGTCNGKLKTGEYFDFQGISNNQLLASVGAAIGLTKNGQPITEFGVAAADGRKGRVDKLLA